MNKDTNTTANSILEVLLSKLKEQSFTIVLMLGGLYYQNKIYDAELLKDKVELDKKDIIIDKLINNQIERMTLRETYLIQQRDKYVEDIINNK